MPYISNRRIHAPLRDLILEIEEGDSFIRDGIVFYIGEIQESRNILFGWSNNSNFDGNMGNREPRNIGFRYSYAFSLTSSKLITLIKNHDYVTNKKINTYKKNTKCKDITEFMEKLNYLKI